MQPNNDLKLVAFFVFYIVIMKTLMNTYKVCEKRQNSNSTDNIQV